MKSFDEQKASLLKLLQDSVAFSTKLGYKGFAQEIEQVISDASGKELMVMIAGEIKRGKSSLTGALLEEPGLFPVDVDVCTNATTIARYNKNEIIKIIIEERNGDKVNYKDSVITREDIPLYATEDNNPANHKRVNCLLLGLPNNLLKEGFSLVDTPGLGSMNLEHAKRTMQFLPSADIVIFVLDCQNPLSETEANFIRNAAKLCSNWLFVINKMDLFTQKEVDQIVQDTRVKLADIINKEPGDILIAAVSSKEMQEFIKTRDKEYWDNSGFKNLRRMVGGSIFGNRCAILILPYLERLRAVAAKIMDDAQIIEKGLASDEATVQQMQLKLEELAAEKSKLLSAEAGWKNDLRHDINIAGLDIQSMLQEQLTIVLNELETLLENKHMLRDMDTLAAAINSSLTNIMYDAKQNLEVRVSRCEEKITTELGLQIQLDSSLLDKIQFTRKENIPYVNMHTSKIDKAVSVGRKLAVSSLGMGAYAGAYAGLLGAVFGFFSGGPVGAVIMAKAAAATFAGLGAAAGTIKGGVDVITKPRHDDIPSIRVAYTTYINQSIQNIRNSVNYAIVEITKYMLDDFWRKLKAETERLNALGNELASSKKLSEEQLKKKKQATSEKKARITGWQKNIELLIGEAGELDAAGSAKFKNDII